MYSFATTKKSGTVTSAAKTNRTYSFTTKKKLTPAAQIYANQDTSANANESEQNKGGFIGGLGYFFEKIGAGFMQGIEGIVDYTVGGVAELFGADEFAEDVFESDWMNYNHADDWYNPSEGGKVAGDVAGGIGSSLPGITAGVAVTIASGGTMAATGVGLVTSGLAAAGTSTKEAFMESGELGAKEFGYGAIMGAVEAGTEALSGALGAGLGKSIKAVGTTFGKTAGRVAGKTVGKTVGKTAVKAASKGVQSLTLKSVAKQAGKEFLSEAFEEGFAEIVSPYAKRLTYDPNAKSATVEEVLYAATIGGISGVLMGGARGGFTQAVNNVRGNRVVKQGGEAEVMALAKQMIDDDAGGEYTPAIKQIYERLSPTIESGAELTGEQRRALGELKTYETANIMQGAAARSAIAAVNGADAIAARLNADGRYKIVDGKFTFVEDASTIKKGATVREITAEDITSGYDANDKSSIYKALKSNDVLRYIASADAAGRFIMSAKEVENAALAGNKIRTQADLNNFIETASEEKKAAVGRELGITDWNTLNIDGLNERISAYRESGKAEAYKQKIAKIEEIKAKAESKARSIPKAISISDGAIQRYADADSNIAVARTGDSFIIYDYTSGNVSKDMTRAEVNAALARYRQSTEANAAPAVQTSTESSATNEAAAEVKSENASTNENLSSEAKNSQNGTEIEIKDEKISKSEAEAKEFDALATEKVKGYDKLSAADKSMIRKIFREARATGISEADALSYARVAARTGLDIQFNKQECYKGKNEAGEDVYHAGFYDPENNRIVVNPETNKKHTVLLIHELSHAMRSYLKNGEVKYFIDKDAKVSKELWDEIKKYYADENGKLDTELALDEASAYYAEALYGTEGAIDLLLGEKPTLRQKILSFFAKSAEYYSTDEKLSREARRHFKKFKAMFDAFAARNQARSAEAGTAGGTESRRASFSSIAFSFYGVDNMTTEEFEAKDYKKTEGYKAYVDECLENMRQTQKSFDEKAARKQVEKSIGGIVSVAVAMKKAGYDISDTAEQRAAKDTKERLLFSSLEPNSDYFTSSDISTICDKRQNFAEIYDEIVKAEEAKGVPKGKRFFDNVDNYFYIHKVLADKGLTQPCRQCYVESMRKNLAPMANAFLTLVQESDGSNTKNSQLYNQSGKDKGKIKSNNATTREEVRKILDGYGFSPNKLTVKMLTTSDGLAQIKLTMPELYERFNSFYGQSKPKMPKGATPFRFGELTALLTDNKGRIKEGLVKKINSTGGFRLQSYSDFQTKNYADVLQVLFEASTLGLNGHAYTKVPAFLDATADTNLKRNISIFMYNDGGKWKIDRNDSFPYTLEQIYDVVRADKSGNTGIIAVVQNEDMAAYVMANDNIGYFIPFHKSGIKMGVVRETTVKESGREIKGYKNIKDHTRQQTEVWAKTTEEHKANTKVSNPINIYEEGLWDFENADGLSRNELIEKNVKAYIDECEKRGYLPKFREYVMNNKKVLNSVLSYAKELGTVAETATVDDISFEYKGYRIPYGYYKCLGDFSMITPDGKASGIEPLSLENYKFDKAVKYFSDAESVRRNEILQQFANGNEREYYRDSTMSAEELQKVIDTKRTEVVNEIVGKSARRYTMAGPNAATADNSRLMTAEAMLAEGKDSETVRKAAGWVKSYDGKWRFEIDDSVAVWHLDSAKPDSKRLFEFGERIYKLGDILDHPELYEAYPQLKEVTVWENHNAKTSGYVVGRNTDNITVQSLADREINKDILIHEIQHIIQNIEGFAPGASVDQFDYKAWGEKEFAAYEKRNEVANKLYAILRRHGVSITKADIEAVRTAFEVRDSIIDYNFMLIESLADNNARTRDLLDQYYAQVQILNLTTPEGQYHAVAGEIEAHDVQARRRMTAEQRKNTRPNIDREDVAFAESILVSYLAKDAYDEEVANIKPQLRHAQDKLNAMEVVFDGRVNRKFERKEDMKKWAKSELKQYGYQVDRQGMGKILFPERAIDDAIGHITDQDEILSIIALFRVLKRGIQIAEHGDHKKRQKHTITIAAPIKINGVRGNMGVVVNLTNNKYYVHRVIMPDGSSFKFDIKKDANQEMRKGVPNGSLADATSFASISSIPQSAEKSTDSAKKVSENSAEDGKASRRASMDVTPELEAATLDSVGKSRFDKPDVKFSEKIKAKFTSVKDKLYIDAVDEMWGIEKYLKEKGGVKDYAAVVQQVRASDTIAQTMIGVAQYDITESGKGKRLGDGITKIFKKYRVRKIEADFNDYLLHQLNVDRMTLRERSLEWQEELLAAYSKAQADFNRAEALVKQGKAKHIPRGIRKALTEAKKAYESAPVLENKPVFGANEKRANDITADESREIIEEYEREHPEFKKSAEEVWAYLRNLQEMRVKGGLISQESADVMAKYYPHYVPSFRDTTKAGGAGVVKNASQLAVKSTIKSAKGGSEDVYDIEESIAVQTMQTVKAIKMNQLARAVYDAAEKSGDTTYVLTREAAEERAKADPDDDVTVDLTPKNNQIVFFLDGKKVEMNVSEELFAGFKGVNDGSVPKSILWKAASKILGGFKNLVTQYSPTFAVRNFIRDMQDAYINTKHPKRFVKNIIAALKDMVNNGAEWQLYLAYGGFASTVFDTKGFTKGVGNRGFEAFRQISGIDENDFKKMGKALKNVLTAVGNANAFIEQLTRFTEFKASLAAGDSVEVAINNSAEVTTNFSRHGKTVKVLNATVIPFLNASVQGFDKLLRVLAGPYRERSLAALGILLVKIFAMGIAPQILNMIMNGDDEDYENLTNEVKENYFLIKAGDEFIKIPRGRAAGAFGGIANRLRNVSRGEDFEFLDYLESLERNVTPVDSISRDIFSPFRDVASNTTWYGGEIEGRQFEGVRPGQRFDESTSEIAKWIGEKINYSPKKIHYLIDQYSGVIGDILLPATTAKAEKGYLASNFLLDPATNNKLSNEFYELYDEAQYSKNEGNITALYQLKHLNDVKSSVSELYDEITKIQQSDKSNSEKLQEVRTIRVLINNLYKTAKTDYAAYTKAIEATDGIFDDADAGEQRIRHAVITQKMYGSEKALKEYNTDIYAKSQLFNKAGVSYDSYYTYYFATKGIQSDLDKDGEVIAGSKRKKVIKAITNLGLSRQETLLLIAASGYKINDGDVRGVSASAAKNMLLKYILGMNATKSEKEELAKACGFKVKNGKILKD